jgi:hypothetical protein
MNKVVIALAVSVLTAGSALASDKGDIMAVLKQWISGSPISIDGGQGRNRTTDTRIFRPLSLVLGAY